MDRTYANQVLNALVAKGNSADDIRSRLDSLNAEQQKQFISQAASKLGFGEGPDIGKGESLLRGAAQGATLGFQDEISPSVERLLAKADQAVGMITNNRDRIERSENVLNKPQEQLRDEYRDENRDAQESNPGAYLGGEIAGSLVSLAPMTAAAAAAPVATGTAIGAIQAAGSSEADSPGGLAWDVAKGGTVGTVLPFAGKGLTALKNKITPTVEKMATSAGRRALGFIKSTIKNKQVGGIEKANEATRNLVGQGAVKWNKGLAATAERIGELKEVAGKQIGSVLDTLDASGKKLIRTDKIKAALGEEFGDLVDDPMFSGLKGKYDDILASIDRHGDAMTFNEAQALKGKLQKLGWKVGRGGEGAELHKVAYLKVRDAIDEAVETAAPNIQQPELSQIFQQAKKNYGAAAKAEFAVEDAIQRQSGNRLISLTDIITGAGGLAAGKPGIGAMFVAAKKAVEGPGMRMAAQLGSKAEKVAPLADKALAPVIEMASRGLRSPVAAAQAASIITTPEYTLTDGMRPRIQPATGSPSATSERAGRSDRGISPELPTHEESLSGDPLDTDERKQEEEDPRRQGIPDSPENPSPPKYRPTGHSSKYRRALEAAAKRGPQAVAAAKYIIAQTDPEERAEYTPNR